MSYPIVGICGQAGVGKDTVADIMVERFGGHKLAFATPMKKAAEQFFPHENVYGSSELRNQRVHVPKFSASYPNNWNSLAFAFEDLFREYEHHPRAREVVENGIKTLLAMHLENGNSMSAREFLQYLGTEIGRAISRSIWVDKGLREADRLLNTEAPFVIITDVRFKNEALAIKKAGGVLLKIEGDGVTTGNDSHASEREQKEIPDFWYDYTLYNSKAFGLEVLRDAVERYLDPNLLLGGAR